MKLKEAIDINIVMGDLEYLIRDGLEDWRSSTPKGLRAVKKILRNAYTLLKRGEKCEKIMEGFKDIFYTNPHNWVTKEYYADEIKKLEKKYFPKEEK